MATGDRDEVFLQKLREFEGLIRYASRRYHIPGVLDPDDLYQEGLLILDKMLCDDYAYVLDPDSIDFKKMFKTELWHGLWKVLQKCKTQKRDWKKLIGKDFSQLERSASSSKRGARLEDKRIPLNFDQGDQSFNDTTFRSTWNRTLEEAISSGLNPEQFLELQEKISEVDNLLDILIERLDDEARIVLIELLHPRSWDEIPTEYKTNGTRDDYWRVPRKVPQHVLARILGWPLIRVRRAVSRIRRHAGALGDELGFDLIAVAGLKKRRRRNAT